MHQVDEDVTHHSCRGAVVGRTGLAPPLLHLLVAQQPDPVERLGDAERKRWRRRRGHTQQRHTCEHHPRDPIGQRRGEVHRDPATERVPDDDHGGGHLGDHWLEGAAYSAPPQADGGAGDAPKPGRSTATASSPSSTSRKSERSRRRRPARGLEVGSRRRHPRRSSRRRRPAARAARYASTGSALCKHGLRPMQARPYASGVGIDAGERERLCDCGVRHVAAHGVQSIREGWILDRLGERRSRRPRARRGASRS